MSQMKLLKSSMLDNSIRSSPSKLLWNKRKRRLYGRLKSSVTHVTSSRGYDKWGYVKLRNGRFKRVHFYKDLYFLTLTSAKKSTLKELSHRFSVLVKRLRRKYEEFEYIRVYTNEGNGVLHILFKGQRIDVNIVRTAWKELNFDSRQMKIIQCYAPMNKLIRYLVGYFCHHDFSRMSWSKKMIFPHFVKIMKELITYYGYKKGLKYWKRLLKGQIKLKHLIGWYNDEKQIKLAI